MKHLLGFSFFTSFFFSSQSQDIPFTLNGKLQQPSSISTFLIAYPKMHMDSVSVQTDGRFTYSGAFSEPGVMQIGTRKTGVTIWLDSDLKNVYLSEKPSQNGKMKLTVDSVEGSEDTNLFFQASLPKVEIVSNPTFKFSIPYSQIGNKDIIDSLIKVQKLNNDSSSKAYFFQKVDSVFKKRPDSKVLPWLIQYYELCIGFDFVRQLYYRLNTEQQQSETGIYLLNLLKRLQLLKPGNLFDDFTMRDEQGKKFKFSSLKSKYVLIDFWASYCGPCRAKHPYLLDVYQKTKQAGLEIVSISLDEDRQKWLDAIQQDKLEWINISDLKGDKCILALKYNITGIPFSVLLDENRKVILVDPSASQIIEFFKKLH